MTANLGLRGWVFAAGVTAVAIFAVSWLFAIHPQLTAASDASANADVVRSQNAALAEKTVQLKQKSTQLGQIKSALSDALAQLPPRSGLPTLSRQLSSQAAAAGVNLTSILVGASATVGETGAGGAPAGADNAAPGTIVAIPVTLLATGTAAHLLAFLNDIQVTGPRRALVTSTSLSAGTGVSVTNSATMTTQMTVFTTPMTGAQLAQLDKLLAQDVPD